MMDTVKKKLFTSHASEDKDDFVRPLAEALSSDFEVWYDEYKLVMGCSLLEEISKGLANCDFGVVILSKYFFEKNWPQQELNGLFALEKKDKKVILPVWKGVSKEEVIKYSPIIADKLAFNADDGVEKVVNEIKKAIVFFERGRTVEKSAPGFNKLLTSLQKKAEEDRSENIVIPSAGVSIAYEAAKQTIHILHDQINNLSENHSIKSLRIDGPKGDGIEYHIHVWIGKICLEAYYRNNVVNSAIDARLDICIFQSKKDYWGRSSPPKIYDRKKYSLYVDINDKTLWKGEDGAIMTPEELVDIWLERFSLEIESK